MDPISISAIILSGISLILLKVKRSKCCKSSCETRSDLPDDSPVAVVRSSPRLKPRHRHKHPFNESRV